MAEGKTECDGIWKPGTASSTAPPRNSFINAILTKYGSMESGIHEMGDVQVYFSAPAKKNKQEQTAAEEQKFPSLKLPSILVLNRCNICKAGEEDMLAELCRAVLELDLAENLLDDWSEVQTIMSRIPNLEFLNLSSNPLQRGLPSAPSFKLARMDAMNKLVLNNTKLPWEMVHSLLRVLPRLEELHLSHNDFSTVCTSADPYPTVRLLHFSNNDTDDWQEIQKLGPMFPALEALYLLSNPIRSLSGCDHGDFPHLRTLCISETRVDSWEEVDRLDGFGELTEVLLYGIPLLAAGRESEQDAKELRQMVIARLRKLVRLNRSQVTETEREEAERSFIRTFKHADERPTRYDELVEKHGSLYDLVMVDLKPQTEFHCQLVHGEQTHDLVVSSTQSISQLKKHVGVMIGLPPSKFRLFRTTPSEPLGQGPDELKFPSRLLHNYHLSDGDEYSIVPKM